MPDTTRAIGRAAMIAEEEGIEITQTSALTGTLRVITVRGWAIARCIGATIAKDSRTDTKMGIEGIEFLEIQLNRTEPDREVGLFIFEGWIFGDPSTCALYKEEGCSHLGATHLAKARCE